MKAADLAALGAELQAELRLRDWRIDYKLVPGLRDAAGRAVDSLHDRLVDNRTATIAVDAASPDPLGALIRELVALHVAPLTPPTALGAQLEAYVSECIGDAMIARWTDAVAKNDTTRAPIAAAKITPKRDEIGDRKMREQRVLEEVARRMAPLPPPPAPVNGLPHWLFASVGRALGIEAPTADRPPVRRLFKLRMLGEVSS